MNSGGGTTLPAVPWIGSIRMAASAPVVSCLITLRANSAHSIPHDGYFERQRAAVAVGVGRVMRARQHRAEVVLGAVADQRKRARRLAVEAAPERQELELLRARLGQAHRGLDRLRAAGVKLHLVQARGRVGGDLLQGLGPAGRRQRADRDLVDLRLQDLAIARVSVAERVHADAGRDVQVAVAVDVLHQAVLAPRDGDAGQRGDRLGAGGQVGGLSGHQRTTLRAGDLGQQERLLWGQRVLLELSCPRSTARPNRARTPPLVSPGVPRHPRLARAFTPISTVTHHSASPQRGAQPGGSVGSGPSRRGPQVGRRGASPCGAGGAIAAAARRAANGIAHSICISFVRVRLPPDLVFPLLAGNVRVRSSALWRNLLSGPA